MIKYYKIKVGIEEFSIEKKDISRIVEAMKTNEMVKLECGIFRGQAILAITRDLQKEQDEETKLYFNQSDQGKILNLEEKIQKQISECNFCDKKGYTIQDKKLKNGSPNPIVKKCSCTIFRGVDMPKGSSPE